MRNRLPKKYSISDPPIGLQPAGAPRFAESSPPESWRERLAGAAANQVGAHPVVSLGAALVVGIILGKLVKR